MNRKLIWWYVDYLTLKWITNEVLKIVEIEIYHFLSPDGRDFLEFLLPLGSVGELIC